MSSNYNPVQHKIYERKLNDAIKTKRHHDKRKNFLYAITALFGVLMLTGFVAGFMLNLGYGIVGVNIVFIILFVVSAFFAGMWAFAGWESEIDEKVETAQENLNEYLSDTASTDFNPPPTTPRRSEA